LPISLLSSSATHSSHESFLIASDSPVAPDSLHFDVVAREEDSVAWDDLARLEESDIANYDVL
jgi:seryl-tRNA(Sec) selenium transferase